MLCKIFPTSAAVEFKAFVFEELSPENGYVTQEDNTEAHDQGSISDITKDAKDEKEMAVESRVYAVQ